MHARIIQMTCVDGQMGRYSVRGNIARSIGLTILVLCLFAAQRGHAAEPIRIAILPNVVSLHGTHDHQRLLVERLDKTLRAAGDVTHGSRLTSSNADIAHVDANGILHPVRDGDTTIMATYHGVRTSTNVHVYGMRDREIWSFRNDVLPVLTREGCNSGSCHGAAAGKGGLKLSLRAYDPDADYNVLTHQANGRRVQPGRPDESLLLLKPLMKVAHGGGQRIQPGSDEERALGGWIRNGATAPAATDIKIESVEVTPSVALMHPGEQQHMLVKAHFSNGEIRDVTPLAKFGSVDGSVAGVTDDGTVKAVGHGETAITVWYSSKVNYARIVSPYPGGVSSVGSTRTDDRSLIDTLIEHKLAELNIPVSSICSDGEFIRRASLDTAGVLPTIEATKAFLADNSMDKRTRYVDQLLSRSEYVDYWSYKWSDLLLLNSKGIPGETLNSFYSYIHKSVEQNKPWNQFVREIITARGSTLDNGAAAFFVIHKDPFDLTETTTQAFMGLSLMCAHCHNHPMERWTQRDYYQMANLYARVRLKNGDKAGEVFVLASSSGDIPHPKLGTPLAPKPLESPEMRPDDPSDRRDTLADWLISKKNPNFSRAIINRVWRNFMGRGLVEAEDDLRVTNPPTNAPLMDALGAQFDQSGYDVKKLIRSILLSSAYQRSSLPVGVNGNDQRYFSHYIVKRLPAEPLLDAIAQVTGVATDFKDLPKSTRAVQLKDSQVASYFLTAFGRPAREKTCACERQNDPNVAQALHLSNGETVNARLKAAGGVIDSLVKENATLKLTLEQLYVAAFCRIPTPAEEARAANALGITDSNRSMKLARPDLEDLYWAVLTSREFVFNH